MGLLMCNFSTAATCVSHRIAKAVLDMVTAPRIQPQDQLLAVLDAALADVSCVVRCDTETDAPAKCTAILQAMRDKLALHAAGNCTG